MNPVNYGEVMGLIREKFGARTGECSRSAVCFRGPGE